MLTSIKQNASARVCISISRCSPEQWRKLLSIDDKQISLLWVHDVCNWKMLLKKLTVLIWSQMSKTACSNGTFKAPCAGFDTYHWDQRFWSKDFTDYLLPGSYGMYMSSTVCSLTADIRVSLSVTWCKCSQNAVVIRPERPLEPTSERWDINPHRANVSAWAVQ